MNLKNKNITFPDGKIFCILEGKPVDGGKRCVYLLNPVGKEPDYSLWYIEIFGEEIELSSYDGSDNEDLIDELLEKYVETALDEY
jgi:hypothetical protein